MTSKYEIERKSKVEYKNNNFSFNNFRIWISCRKCIWGDICKFLQFIASPIRGLGFSFGSCRGTVGVGGKAELDGNFLWEVRGACVYGVCVRNVCSISSDEFY